MLKAKHKTGLVFFPAFDWAISPTHPEREERLLYTQDQVLEEGLFDIDGITEFKPDLVTPKDINRERLVGEKEFEERTRRIFYDTDGIRESQTEQNRLCPDCAGAWQIDSTSDRGYRILAVHIPRKACKNCRQLGYDWLDVADPDAYHFIFLQDRTKDEFVQIGVH